MTPLGAFAFGAASNAAGNLVSDGIEGLLRYTYNGTSFSSDTASYERLQREAALLRSQRDDNEELRTQRKKRSSGFYLEWLSRVNEILQNVEALNASTPGEIVQEMLDEVLNLQQRGGDFEKGFWDDRPTEPKPVVKISPPDIKSFTTLQKSLDELLQHLGDGRVKVIGVHGLPGVGKTTIMQNLNDHEEVTKMFQIIIWVKVSKESTNERLQRDIARRLDLNLPTDSALSNLEAAESISEKLKDMKFLLLLDDVEKGIDLNAIGIRGIFNGSKVVLTTRYSDVCNDMMANRMINVIPLSESEAWSMFLSIASDQIDLPGVEPIARQVAKKCHGFLILIKTVANHFRKKNSAAEWRNGLKKLRIGSKVEIPGLKDTHSIVKFCCDNLEDEKKKLCFLYGALHPADMISIDYLMKCWAAERFLGDIDEGGTFRSACDEGYEMLRDLTGLSLLQKDRMSEHVQVNNMLREVALHISSNMSEYIFLTGNTELSDALRDMKTSDKAKGIFVVDTRTCGELLSLLVQGNSGSETIRPGLFAARKKLHVLNMHKTGIEMLPPSFSLLAELKALFLKSCTSLTSLPHQIQKLVLLEVLDIRRCRLIFISHFIRELKNLRCLKVSYYKSSTGMYCEEDLKRNCQVISGLSRLEELVIDVVTYDQWCHEAVDVIQHVASLEKLTSLKIHFPKLEDLKSFLERKPQWKDLVSDQLLTFWFSIGRENDNPSKVQDHLDYKINRFLRFCPDGNDHDTTSDIFPEMDAFELIGHENITCLSKFMEAPGLNKVRGCLLQGCSKIVTIVDDNNAVRGLSKLHAAVVKSCPALKKISSSSGVIHKLPILKTLVVRDCSTMKELIENSGDGLMQSLEVLELHDLPNLSAIVDQNATFLWPRLKKLLISKCPKLKKLPFNKENAAELKLIQGEQVWWDDLQWENNDVKGHFSNAFSKVRI